MIRLRPRAHTHTHTCSLSFAHSIFLSRSLFFSLSFARQHSATASFILRRPAISFTRTLCVSVDRMRGSCCVGSSVRFSYISRCHSGCVVALWGPLPISFTYMFVYIYYIWSMYLYTIFVPCVIVSLHLYKSIAEIIVIPIRHSYARSVVPSLSRSSHTVVPVRVCDF